VSRVIRPDPDRRIDLPGVGPVARPLEVGKDVSGLTDISLRTYRFDAGNVIDGEAEGDEVLLFVLFGQVNIEVGPGSHVPAGEAQYSWSGLGRAAVGSGAPRGIYLPPHHAYRLEVVLDSAIAYARADAAGVYKPRVLSWVGKDGAPATQVLPVGSTERLGCEEVFIDAGNQLSMSVPYDSVLLAQTSAEAAAEAVVTAGKADQTHMLGDGEALALGGGSEVVLSAPTAAGLTLIRFWAT